MPWRFKFKMSIFRRIPDQVLQLGPVATSLPSDPRFDSRLCRGTFFLVELFEGGCEIGPRLRDNRGR